ncbi:dihydrolipoyl dehydrogenase [Paenibacillus contaminans]|uniref:dihydrolipoyl dehydrogenase n=1 Tax=Paenibacillus contaminans TaxID=450362 RepID=UPI001EE01A62|nr:dihydrolipoyl dehydrogenase [Paenibacillus contaminans]
MAGENRLFTIDVLVVGAGPGGYVAAIRAAQLGKSVMIADKSEWGGICLNSGCIPSKALISAAHSYEAVSASQAMGITAEQVKVDFAKVQSWKNGIVKKMAGGIAGLLSGNQIQAIHGEITLINDHEAILNNGLEQLHIRFEYCILATGSHPIELKSLPFGGRILSSADALELQEIPGSLIVIGGGYIGIELGQTFSKFGAKVTILEGSERILPGFEQEMAQAVAKRLNKKGVTVHHQAIAISAKQTSKDVTVTFLVNGEERQITADYVLVAVGRRPNTDSGLDRLGLRQMEGGLVHIDRQCRTSLPNIFAVGDIVAGPALAHKASYEGKVAAEAIAGMSSEVDYRAIPMVVFSDPELASVGLSEAEAAAQGIDIAVGKFPYAANGRALSLQANEGFVKLVADRATGIILGAQIAGAEASGLIAEMGLAVEMGATLQDVAITIHAHPTLGEMTMEAAEAALGYPIHQLSSRGSRRT